ncbi:MAG TPA: hypothetical protein VFO58_20675 [Vicinamibacterales bacterium]|nr:hypothetical protein [Vicinamibacterales bacterium]
MMLLLRALSASLVILVVLVAPLAAQQRDRPDRRPPGVVPPNVPPLTLPVVHGDNEWLELRGRLGRPAFLQAQAKPTQQEEFTPVSELPPEEQLAAAPLLIGAYAFVLAVLFGYLVTVSRRLSAITRDINRLTAEMKTAGRG